MAGALMAENQRLNEDQIYSERQQKPIKSLDMDDGIDPDNIVLMECDDQHIGDPKMRARVAFLHRTLANVNRVGPNDALKTAWSLASSK